MNPSPSAHRVGMMAPMRSLPADVLLVSGVSASLLGMVLAVALPAGTPAGYWVLAFGIAAMSMWNLNFGPVLELPFVGSFAAAAAIITVIGVRAALLGNVPLGVSIVAVAVAVALMGVTVGVRSEPSKTGVRRP